MLLSLLSGMAGQVSADTVDSLLFLKSREVRGLYYYLYLPSSPADGRRLLVTVHGVSRNAREHISLFREQAERQGIAMLAPIFSRQGFRDYQRLGRKGRGPRADLALIRLLEEVSALYAIDIGRVDMFGYSGGGQFVHRFAFAHPDRVSRLMLGAPGWYTLPDVTLGYPYGIADARGLEGIRFDPEAIAQLSFTVFVGDRDNLRDGELNQSEMIDRLQGTNRIDRGRNWADAMNRNACLHEAGGHVRFAKLPGTSHSFEEAVTTGGLDRLLFRILQEKHPESAGEQDICRHDELKMTASP